jgi:seryl-tRNA synthetase
MLDPKYLRSDITEAAARLATRGYVLDVAAVNVLEEKRKDLQSRTQELQAERNARSKSIGEAARRGEDVAPLKAEVTKINDELETSKVELEALLAQLKVIADAIPNLPSETPRWAVTRTTTWRSAAGVPRVSSISRYAITSIWVRRPRGSTSRTASSSPAPVSWS